MSYPSKTHDMPEAESVFVIIPVHNRKEVTLKCLANLATNGDLYAFNIVIIDDGSTDGTTEAIRTGYPEVTILKGDGNLWWTGAITIGMKYAYEHGADFLIWLNDDAFPLPQSLHKLVNYCGHHEDVIVSAQCYENELLNQPTYGGHYLRGLKHLHAFAPPGEVVSCVSLSGNLVCFPRSVIDQIGYPPYQKVPQYYGDVIYTWYARKAGFQLLLLGESLAICKFNLGNSRWLLGNKAALQQIKALCSPKSLNYPPGFWHFCNTVWPIYGTLVFVRFYVHLFVILLIRVLVPRSVLIQVKQRFREGYDHLLL